MSGSSNKDIALAYLAAIYAGENARAVSYLDENIDFLVNAPVELLPHLGHRRGRAAVKEMLDIIRLRYPEMKHQVRFAAADHDKVATHISVFFRKSHNGRIVQIDVADFFRFQNGLIAQIRHFMDSFDLAQQVLELDISALLAKTATQPGI